MLAVQDYLLLGKLTVPADIALAVWIVAGAVVWAVRRHRVTELRRNPTAAGPVTPRRAATATDFPA